MTTYGNAGAYGNRPPYYGPPSSVPAGDSTQWVPRTLLVASLGGIGVGAAAGTFALPILGTAIGAVVGGSFGLGAGASAVAVLAFVLRRPRDLPSWAARALFVAPTVIAVAVWASFSLALLYSQLQAPTGFTYDWVMIATFAIPTPLAPTLMLAAAPWCLQSRVPSLRRPKPGRLVWFAAVPILVALVAAFPLAMSLV